MTASAILKAAAGDRLIGLLLLDGRPPGHGSDIEAS
jgi:hypothetical protein